MLRRLDAAVGSLTPGYFGLIPVLVAMGWWRHRIHKIPLTSEATMWSIVFPLGMYSVASTYPGRADQLPIVELVGTTWIWVAVGAWTITFAAMLRHLVLTIARPPVADAGR